MAGTAKLFAGTTVIGLVAAGYLLVQNRGLRAELAAKPAPVAAVTEATTQPVDASESAPSSQRAARIATMTPGEPPALPEIKKETRLERRARRTEEFAAMFGRHDGETEEEYRARIGPMISAGLALPRMRAIENRRVAEERANVTAEQSARLDQAFDKVYGDVLDYTNKAIADSVLSPYERNVAGWLDYAGGLGGVLTEAQGQIGKILTPDQLKAMSASGFEWGEYLGLSAPWEKLQAPPPPRN